MTANRAADAGGRRGGTDRRVRRTRHALRHALMDLVVEQGYDRLTVQAIIERADVGRSSFYAHFRDRDDLLASVFDDEIDAAFRSGAAGEAPSRWLFRHSAEHRALYQALVRRRGGWPLVRRRLEDTLTEVLAATLRSGTPTGDVPVEVAARFVANALLGLLTWWLDQGMPVDAGTIDDRFRTLANRGVTAALGVEL